MKCMNEMHECYAMQILEKQRKQNTKEGWSQRVKR